jgi:eukaryotic-like serine/threonine-protein kinase
MEGDRQSQIDQLVQSALALQAEERASYLEEACADLAIREAASRILLLLNKDSPAFDPAPVLSEEATQLAPKPPQDERINKIYGTYQVRSRIGSGGMGEVYLAFDTRLGRQAALKFLSAHTATDETLVRRFQLEARTASSLNHPNILTIFDIGKFGNQHYIASEFVEGATLRARLRQGPFDLPEALEIIVQVASALVAAHAAGIIHRDLKPTNIMLRPDGYIKVIDFGLAKRTQSLVESEAEEAYTRPGSMIGTVDYMSPEQTRGQGADFRTDIWSAGVIFYEMLAGRRPFAGASEYEVITQILEGEPKPAAEPGRLPVEVERVLKRCLQKDREDRYASTTDFYQDLREARRALNLSSLSQAPVRTVSRRGTKRGLFVAGAALLALVGGGWWQWRRQQVGPETIDYVPEKRVTSNGQVKRAAISPDGRYVAYAAGSTGHETLFIKPLESASESVLVPEANVTYRGVTFSNDGQDVYYVSRAAGQELGRLFKVPITHGDSQLVTTDVDGPAAMAPAGAEIAFVRQAGNKSQLIILGGAFGAQGKAVLEFTDVMNKRIAWSPRGKELALLTYPASNNASVQLHVFNAGSRRITREVNVNGWRAAEQFAWLNNNRDLLIASATPDETDDRMQIREVSTVNGSTRNVISDMYGYKGLSQTADGQHVVTVRQDRQTRFWFSTSRSFEKFRQRAADSSQYYAASWTDDNKLIAQANRGDGVSLWLIDPSGRQMRELTDKRWAPRDSVWLPHHRSVVFTAQQGQSNGIWRMDLDEGTFTQLVKWPDYLGAPASTPDGQHVLYAAWGPYQAGIWIAPTQAGQEAPRLLIPNARNPVVSPDGTEIAAEAFDGNSNTWITSIFDFATLQRRAVFPSIPAGAKVKWHPDGSGLDYLKTEEEVTNVWLQPVEGSAKAITHFQQDEIFDFAWSPGGEQMLCLKGQTVSDGILLKRRL